MSTVVALADHHTVNRALDDDERAVLRVLVDNEGEPIGLLRIYQLTPIKDRDDDMWRERIDAALLRLAAFGLAEQHEGKLWQAKVKIFL